jgi:hypothetical protein
MRLGAATTLSALALVVVSGCSDLSPTGPGAACASDLDCVALGEVCFLGLCTPADEGLLSTVDLEIRPLDGAESPPQQIIGVDITVDDRVILNLKGRAAVEGTVCEGGDDGRCSGESASPLAARLVAVPEIAVPGRRLAVVANSSAQGGYTLDLLHDATYRVRVYPDDESLAPYFRPAVISTFFFDEDEAVDLPLPLDADLVHVSGRVLAGEGSGAIGIDSLEVQIIDGGRRVSSITRTGQDGYFVLSLGAEATESARLLIRPTEDNPGFPEVAIDGLAFDEMPDLGDITLGDVLAPVTLTGTVTGNDGAPVASAALYLRGDVGLGEVRRLLTTDDEGTFTSDLPPGAYDLVAVAPTTASAAGMVMSGEPIVVGPGREPLNLVLSARVEATGGLSDANGDTLAGASLTFVRLGPPGGGTERVLDGAAWQFQTLTDDTGRWSVRVDPGRYRVSCVPSELDNAPAWQLVTDIFSSAEPLDIQLPPVAILAGEIRRPDSTTGVAEGTEVRAFAQLVGEDGEAIPLGIARTDADGRFNMRLPDLFSHQSSEPEDPDAGVAGSVDSGL